MNRFICLAVALVYASFLTSIPMAGLKDRENYLDMAVGSLQILARNINNGVLFFFTNEPVWFGLNSLLGLIFEPEFVVQLIVFFSSFTVAYIVLRHGKANFLLLMLLLVMPLVVKNFIIHLRQGLAIAIFLLGWFSVARSRRWFFFLLTPFIHSSFFIVLPLLIFSRIALKLRFATDIRICLYASLGVAVGIGITVLAAALGARQATTTAKMDAGISGLGFVMWVMVTSLFLLQGRNFNKKYAAEFGFLFFYLATYFFTPITGRLFESTVILVLMAGLRLTSYRKYSFLSIIFLFTAVFFIIRIGQPLLGYGV